MMRGLGDALRIRDRVIERFEETTLAHGKVPESALTFVVIGGATTGVEVASEIHALVHEALVLDYPNIDPHRVRIVLLEAGPHILAELDPALRHAARTELVARRIEVMTRARRRSRWTAWCSPMGERYIPRTLSGLPATAPTPS
jgi:NADH:ubiquinone reductase (H+-translocating)